ncbi:MAG: GlsB/YeaQ/YmgE family stress response membrane protein [Saprospiraceae bacterium]|nr:GlsB/YeaQ/YmgE family stress response membrane protein [Saprospiraceae bacterium]MDZ4705548.1 GlsB/YeaQ/YmgE family stress response membrane protein [Saprospiraceae bacterium]
MSWLYIIVVGGIAGWLSGLIMKGAGFGLLGNIVVGVIGAVVGSWLFGFFGLSAGKGMLGSILMAMIGAVMLLWVARLLKIKT